MFVSVDSGTVSYTRVWLEQKFGILATAAVEFAVVVFTSFLQRGRKAIETLFQCEIEFRNCRNGNEDFPLRLLVH